MSNFPVGIDNNIGYNKKERKFSQRRTILSEFYNSGSRKLQDQLDSRRIADRLEHLTVHDNFTLEDQRFIERSCMFF